jgi:hypothetical protein
MEPASFTPVQKEIAQIFWPAVFGRGSDAFGAPGAVPLILFDLGFHVRQAGGQPAIVEVKHRGQAAGTG